MAGARGKAAHEAQNASKRVLSASTEPDVTDLTNIMPALVRLSEREFQRILRAALEDRGYVVWTVPNMKLTTAGLPDILAYHPARPGVLLAWELKRERRYRVSPEQTAALAHLATIPGVDARIVKPSDWFRLRSEV